MKTYQEAIDFLFQQLPMYQRVGAKAFKKDLTNIMLLTEYLDNPQHSLKCIHIAGTNGKGSTAHGIASVLQAAGLKVGLYTSPHYRDFRERIKINGQYISEEAVMEFVQAHKAYFAELKPSFFEITVALAFQYFAQQEVDIAVIETGLGGRLDSTNIITPLLSVITNISYDHTNFLGDTLAKIAYEKAGIIKQDVPVVIGETHYETSAVFKDKAAAMNAPIYFADQLISASHTHASLDHTYLNIHRLEDRMLLYPDLVSDLTGPFQPKNLLTILQTMEVLPQIGIEISRKQVRMGLRQVHSACNYMGRWQVLQASKPTIIADSAHNEGGLAYTMTEVKKMPHDDLHIVLGMVKDKDLSKLLALFPKQATYYFCKPNVPRGLAANLLQDQAHQHSLVGGSYTSVKAALSAAHNNAHNNDIIYVGGSTYVVAEII